MRYFMGILLVCLSCTVFANQKSALDVSESIQDDAKEIMELTIQAVNEMFDVMIKCEADDLCVLNAFEKLSNSSENPVLVLAIEETLSENKEEIVWLRENKEKCEIDDLKQVKKHIASCLPILKEAVLEESDPKANEALSCMLKGFIPLANQDNIFAVATLVDLYESMEMKESYELYASKLETLKNQPSPHLEVLNKCLVNWM